MTVSNTLNLKFFSYISGTINLKTTGDTTIFTTYPSPFLLTGAIMLCITADTPNQDAVFNLGWTATAYDDYQADLGWSNTIAGTNTPISFNGDRLLIPASTDFKINVTSAETGTALTGRLIILGNYIE